MTLPAMLDGVPTQAQLARPLGDRQAFAVPVDNIRQAAISILLERVGPSAILRRIALRIVETIHGVLQRWSWSHVFVECDKGLTPAITDDQADTAIAWKQHSVRVMATLNDLRPNVVFGALVKAVFCANGGYGLASQAATRLLSGVQSITFDLKSLTAFTATFPIGDFVGIRVRCDSSVQYSQTSVSVARPVNDWSAHNYDCNILRQRFEKA